MPHSAPNTLTHARPPGAPSAFTHPPAHLDPGAAGSRRQRGQERRRGEERRRQERAPLDLVVFTYPVGEADRSASWTESRDVSPAGMFIATDKLFPKGKMVFVEAFPPDTDEPPVRSLAVVRWTRRWFHPRGMGVELLKTDRQDRQRLMRWMGRTEERAPA